jgi:lipid A 3-O-deacylase
MHPTLLPLAIARSLLSVVRSPTWLLFIIILNIPVKANAQEKIPLAKDYGAVRLNYDNDYFSASDMYYTQGIRLEFLGNIFSKSPFAYTLIKKGPLNYYGLSVSQDCFTPYSIRRDTIFTGERPFGAAMYLSHYLVSINPEKKYRLNTQLDLGAIGPCALCEEEQKGIHAAIGDIEPLGWQFQLSQDYMVNYSIGYEKELFAKKDFEIIGTSAMRLGTIYNDGGMGMTLRAGWLSPYFETLGIKPSSRKFHCYGFVKGSVKFVAYNAMLQGGFFSDDIYTLPSSSVKRLVGTAYTGIVLAYKGLSIEYTKAFMTPEFENGLSHKWGHCVISVSF